MSWRRGSAILRQARHAATSLRGSGSGLPALFAPGSEGLEDCFSAAASLSSLFVLKCPEFEIECRLNAYLNYSTGTRTRV